MSYRNDALLIRDNSLDTLRLFSLLIPEHCFADFRTRAVNASRYGECMARKATPLQCCLLSALSCVHCLCDCALFYIIAYKLNQIGYKSNNRLFIQLMFSTFELFVYLLNFSSLDLSLLTRNGNNLFELSFRLHSTLLL